MLFILLARLVVDVCQCIELVDYDIDVVAANTVTLAGYALAFVGTSNGVELATADLVLDRVEVGSDSVNTGRIANEDNAVCQEFGLQMQMEA
jgi:hypothetical protein